MVNFSHDSMISVMNSNFPYLGSNIPEPPAYGVFVSQLIRHTHLCHIC